MAAAVGAVPAPPVPLVVAIFTGSHDWPLEMPANTPVVTATPFLQWMTVAAAGPGAPPTVRLPQYKAAKAFLGRCTLSTNPADRAMFAASNCLTFGLSGPCWGRLLTQLDNAGLFTKGPFTNWVTFLLEMRALNLPAGSMSIAGADLQDSPSFDDPGHPGVPAVPAIPGRGGRGGRGGIAPVPGVPAIPAIPPTPGPVTLDFLALLTLDQLEQVGYPEPFFLWGDLLGGLGPCAERATRASAASTVQAAAFLLRNSLSLHLLGGINQSQAKARRNALHGATCLPLRRATLSPNGLRLNCAT